jgi:signal transduction histidine kinase
MFLIISIVSYFVLQKNIEDEAKENLTERISVIDKKIQESDILPDIYPIVQAKKVMRTETIAKPFATVFISHENNEEYQKYIEYRTISKINGNYYLITVRQSVVENKELLMTIVISLLSILLLTFTLAYFLSKKMTELLWSDFEFNLIQIENFNFHQQHKLILKDTGVEEFDRLNKVVIKLTDKLKKDYHNLKEFSENASHELQTPLAVISTNLEEVLQEDLPKNTSKKVYSTYQAIKKLSKINQGLLLLTKIDNKQFTKSKDISFADMLNKKIEELMPLAESKQITIKTNITNDLKVNANRQLIDILLSNLLSNAIIHNITNGYIKITLQNENLTICNSGKLTGLDNKTIFRRFTKRDSESSGLGLAIAKQICKTSKLDIDYKFTQNEHCIIIKKYASSRFL